MQKLFVYGTLKKEGDYFPLERFEGTFKYLGNTRTADLFSLSLEWGLPVMTKKPRRYPIYGEVYLVSNTLLIELDRFEKGYNRDLIELMPNHDKVWCYLSPKGGIFDKKEKFRLPDGFYFPELFCWESYSEAELLTIKRDRFNEFKRGPIYGADSNSGDRN